VTFIELRTANDGTRAQVPTTQPIDSIEGKRYLYVKAGKDLTAGSLYKVVREVLGWEVLTTDPSIATNQRYYLGVPVRSVKTGEYVEMQIGGLLDKVKLPNAVNTTSAKWLRAAAAGSGAVTSSSTGAYRAGFGRIIGDGLSSADQTDLLLTGLEVWT
jgi:hypothetical protein